MKNFVKKLLILAAAAGMAGSTAFASEPEESLTVWCWDPDVNFQALGEAAEWYSQLHPELDFQMEATEVSGEEIREALKQAAEEESTEALPDLLLVKNDGFQKYLEEAPGIFGDLTDSGIVFQEFRREAVSLASLDGRNYGGPFDLEVNAAFYRTDLLEEAGYTMEDVTDLTWGEYQRLGEAILAETGTPLMSWVKGDPGLVLLMVQSAGGSLFDEEGNLFLEGNEVFQKAQETYENLVKAGVIKELEAWDEYDLYVQDLQNGAVMGGICPSGILASLAAGEEEEGKWGITNLPALEEAEASGSYGTGGGTAWAVVSGENEEAAARFLAETFGSSLELYEDLVPLTGAVFAYEPVLESGVYQEAHALLAEGESLSELLEYERRAPRLEPGLDAWEAEAAVKDALEASGQS